VTEAKRQLFGTVGIDGLAGPTELAIVLDAGADVDEVVLDLLAQAEHGNDSPLVAISSNAKALDRIAKRIPAAAGERPSVAEAPLALIKASSLESALELADALAPEHLELCFRGANDEVARKRVAGCVFIGTGAGAAFGDYATGSNHVLPTGGAARFGGPLGARTFRRRTSVVNINKTAAKALAPTVDEIAKAEGLPVHGESARARAGRKTR
jgi:histidinol dehydrogenase